MKFVKVGDLHVKCSLRVRNFGVPGIAMSDCCAKPATHAVEMENGSKMWRCFDHREVREIKVGKTSIYVEKN